MTQYFEMPKRWEAFAVALGAAARRHREQEEARPLGGDVDAELLCRGIRTLAFPAGCARERRNSTRTRNALRDAEIVYVAELARMTEEELLRVPLIGKTGVAAAGAALASVGLGLGTTFDEDEWTSITARCAEAEATRRQRLTRARAEEAEAEAKLLAEFEELERRRSAKKRRERGTQ